MTPTKNKAAYWDAAGPAIALAVERKYYFKKLIRLCYSLPNDEVCYLLPLEICRWLDKGYDLEDFINWVECSSAGTTEQKSVILNKLLPGTHIRLIYGMVELGAILGKFCEKIGEQRDTPGWGLLKWMLSREEITSSSTMLHNGYPKGYVFHSIMYLDDVLGFICENRFNLEIFYSIYKEICYGEPAQLLQKAKILLAPAVLQLDSSNANDKLLNNRIKAEGTSSEMLAQTITSDLQKDNPVEDAEPSSTDESISQANSDDTTESSSLASLTSRQRMLIYIYEDRPTDSESIKQLTRDMGRTAPTSERQIIGKYNKISRDNDRLNATGKVLVDLIKDIEKAIPHLSVAGRLRAEEELQKLHARKETGY